MTRDFLAKNYLCAQCWGILVERWRDGQWIAECSQAGPEHYGFVTASFVNYRRMAAHLEYAEVRSRYAEMFGLPRANLAMASAVLYGTDEGL